MAVPVVVTPTPAPTVFDWAKIIAVLSAIAGVTGTVLTPLIGTSLASGVQVVLQAISGLLLLIAGGGATVVVHTNIKAAHAMRLAQAGSPVTVRL